jgi:hypothetical protein
MGFGLSTRDQAGFIFAIGPDQYDDFPWNPSQTYEALFAVVITRVLLGNHRGVEGGITFDQVDLVLALVSLTLGSWIIDNYCICI